MHEKPFNKSKTELVGTRLGKYFPKQILEEITLVSEHFTDLVDYEFNKPRMIGDNTDPASINTPKDNEVWGIDNLKVGSNRTDAYSGSLPIFTLAKNYTSEYAIPYLIQNILRHMIIHLGRIRPETTELHDFFLDFNFIIELSKVNNSLAEKLIPKIHRMLKLLIIEASKKDYEYELFVLIRVYLLFTRDIILTDSDSMTQLKSTINKYINEVQPDTKVEYRGGVNHFLDFEPTTFTTNYAQAYMKKAVELDTYIMDQFKDQINDMKRKLETK